MGPLPMIPTTLVGSYPQPEWLIDRGRLLSNLPARVRMKELWRIPEPQLQEAQDDATALAIRDFDEAMRLNPAQPEAYLNKGAALMRLANAPNAFSADSRRSLSSVICASRSRVRTVMEFPDGSAPS